MKAKRNRYDLSLWDVRKLSLYGRSAGCVQAATLKSNPGAAFLGSRQPTRRVQRSWFRV